MKLFVVCALVCLVASVKANHQVSMTLEECDECSCEPPREKSLLNEVDTGLGCFCPCARRKNETCNKDGNCLKGFYCAKERKHGNEGLCHDVCKRPGLKCGLFDPCVPNSDTGEAECICRMFDCSDILIGHGVCATDLDNGNKTVFYPNECKYVNVKCQRNNDKLKGLTLADIANCAQFVDAEEIAKNPSKFASILKK